jgi:CubicO group peptidase (beta-lactamase class C family)
MVTRAPLVYARVTAASVERGRWWRAHGGDRTGQAQGSKAMKRAWGWSLVRLIAYAVSAGHAATTCAFATASPESQNMSRARLDELRASLQTKRTTAYLVIRNDKVVDEWYASGYSRTTKHFSASTAKGLMGGVCAAVAISDGRLTLDSKVATYVSQWNSSRDSRKRQITLRHLGSHTSGLEDAVDGDPFGDDFWARLDPPDDPFTLSRDEADILFTPGSRYQYSNPGFALLSYLVTARMGNLRTLLRDRAHAASHAYGASVHICLRSVGEGPRRCRRWRCAACARRGHPGSSHDRQPCS